ncbi:HPP family protein [Streptomyces sp. TRM49041]|uniref:CBS domain-containing protein n=1 Tax=Streptomyces sp. TRM49041 TaxID=2603216 RepID=UPI0011EF9C05|nr:CBS domain-containing protein [Streptomyces sp. TRM49041]
MRQHVRHVLEDSAAGNPVPDPAQDEVPRQDSPPAEDVPVLEQAVGDVMRTSVVAVAAGETVLVAWELLERSRARHLPVVLPDGRCAGVLDRAEVAVVCAAPAVSLSRRHAGDLLRRRCAVVHLRDSVRRAVDVMDANSCDALPVVEDGGRLVGLLTAADVVSVLAGRPVEVLAGAGPRPPWPFPAMPGLPPRGEDGRVTPVP